MPTISLEPGPDLARSLAQHIDRFLARLPADLRSERRQASRIAIPLLLQLTPLTEEGCPLAGETSTAVGKDLSRSGVSFYHREPLPHRHVQISFEDPRLERLCVEVELNRCRFSNLGWYESGGRLLRIATPEHTPSLAG
ncbi:MAG: hypothetical protein AAGF31_05920 [Planctomycetota bacterium]